jgi:hypothetical protein
MRPVRGPFQLLLTLAVSLLAPVAQALPAKVTVTPPSGARFIEDQRFDIRVEGVGTGPFQASLTVDGEPLQRASDAGGFYLRGQVAGGQAVYTAGDIPVSAYSSGSDVWREFGGVQTNTDVFFKLVRAAMGGDRDGR